VGCSASGGVASVAGRSSAMVQMQRGLLGLRGDLDAAARAGDLRRVMWIPRFCLESITSLLNGVTDGTRLADRTEDRQTLRSPRTARHKTGTPPCPKDRRKKSAGHRLMGAGAPRLFGLLNPAAGFRAAGEWCYGEKVASNDFEAVRLCF